MATLMLFLVGLIYNFLGKRSWPELLGLEGEVAQAIIKRENPSLDVVIVLENSSVTKEIRFDRVRVWINKAG